MFFKLMNNPQEDRNSDDNFDEFVEFKAWQKEKKKQDRKSDPSSLIPTLIWLTFLSPIIWGIGTFFIISMLGKYIEIIVKLAK